MLFKEKQITELYNLKHMHDTDTHAGFNYEDNLMKNMGSIVLFKNKTLAEFINKLQKMLIVSMDEAHTWRNFFNYNVDRHYNKHTD